jgi:hypothetical protein
MVLLGTELSVCRMAEDCREKLGTLCSQTTNSVKDVAAKAAGKHRPELRERGTKR